MPRKIRAIDEKSPARFELPAKREVVPISRLRLGTVQEGSQLDFDESRYVLRVLNDISSDVISLLLELHPLAVVRRERHFTVLSGARLFKIAAFCLDPSTEIPVLVLDKRFVSGHEDLLRYLDRAVMPLLHTLHGSAYELFQIFNEAGLRKQVWLPPLDRSVSAFARALDVKPAALSPPSTGSPKRRKVSPPPASDKS